MKFSFWSYELGGDYKTMNFEDAFRACNWPFPLYLFHSKMNMTCIYYKFWAMIMFIWCSVSAAFTP